MLDSKKEPITESTINPSINRVKNGKFDTTTWKYISNSQQQVFPLDLVLIFLSTLQTLSLEKEVWNAEKTSLNVIRSVFQLS